MKQYVLKPAEILYWMVRMFLKSYLGFLVVLWLFIICAIALAGEPFDGQ